MPKNLIRQYARRARKAEAAGKQTTFPIVLIASATPEHIADWLPERSAEFERHWRKLTRRERHHRRIGRTDIA